MSLAAAFRIGRHFVRNAIWHEGRCNWVSRTPSDNGKASSVVFESLGPTLFNGTAGVAWFLAHLHAATGDANVRRTALGAMRHGLDRADDIEAGRRLSFYGGETGVLFAALSIDDDEIRSHAVARLRGLKGRERDRCSSDLAAGLAGTAAVFPILGRKLADESWTELALRIADRLLRRARRSARGLSWPSDGDRHVTGFAHGAAGIACALLELFRVTGEIRMRDAAIEALRFVDSGTESATYWCRGAAGIALSRIRAFELLGMYEVEARAGLMTTQRALRTALLSEAEDKSLCHGVSGGADVILEGARLSAPDPGALPLAFAAGRLMAASPGRWNAEPLSLFAGLAGRGYLNLRLHDRSVPSVLLVRGEDFA